MSTKPLTAKQEKFVLAVVEGKTQADAYRLAYDTSKMTDKTVHERASVLMSDNKVRTRYNELINKVRKSAEDKAIVTVENVLESILKIREVCMQTIPLTSKVTGDTIAESMLDTTGALKANEMLGKTLKMFTDKLEVAGALDINNRVTLIDKYMNDDET